MLLRLRQRTFGRDAECGQVKVTASSISLLFVGCWAWTPQASADDRETISDLRYQY